MKNVSVIGRIPADEKPGTQGRQRHVEGSQKNASWKVQPQELPASKMPSWGWKHPHNLRGPLRATPPAHRCSSRVLGGAYPFLAETGDILTGAYIGENLLSRAPFCFDPWDAYSAEAVRSHSVAILGVKGTGKSMLAKSWSSRLARLGRKIAVPHDPNGEWVRVAEYVGGTSITVGPGKAARINLLDEGPRDPLYSDEDWNQNVLQYRRATVKTIIRRLREGGNLEPVEHTALDVALDGLRGQTTVTITHVYSRLVDPDANLPVEVADAGHRLAHTLRRMVSGDLTGFFDGPSTVQFDADAPMMVVDTSALKGASPEAQALARLATANWIRRSSLGANRQARVIIHEEAAVELLNDVSGGDGLAERVEDEKVARHLGISNWYLLHRVADLDALGDRNSALHSRALGLLADCETRISYAQHSGEIARSREILGWNDTQAGLVRKLHKGEGLWQIGQDRVAKVRNICTDYEMGIFRTDAFGGERS
ncbi:ATP-binding protein [Diaminobutyricibacter tongyongensis]|uniref:ATP-binding protein n=1 Tax=Leifsonia tongyongensis TaxID=1268043 RepID=A0A6L9Y1T4_9MICO|nr:ATP-binding protein [Diaminobutyricibacter tongyongensis]NEN07649.1 ATP-binding protein [Diaminobutyricibacter tongyongensis]